MTVVVLQDGKEEEAVSACRLMFREEMVRLRREVEEFKELCVQQVRSASFLSCKHFKCGGGGGVGEDLKQVRLLSF